MYVVLYKQAEWTTKFHEQEITGWQKTIYYLDLFFRNGGLLVRRWRKAKTTLWTAQFLAKISRKRECVKTGRKQHCIWPDTCFYIFAFSWHLTFIEILYGCYRATLSLYWIFSKSNLESFDIELAPTFFKVDTARPQDFISCQKYMSTYIVLERIWLRKWSRWSVK